MFDRLSAPDKLSNLSMWPELLTLIYMLDVIRTNPTVFTNLTL